MTDRLEWTIVRKSNWIATNNETGETLVATTKEKLMNKINLSDAIRKASK